MKKHQDKDRTSMSSTLLTAIRPTGTIGSHLCLEILIGIKVFLHRLIEWIFQNRDVGR